MGLFGFKRYEGIYAGQQKFYDEQLPVCPLCGTKEPYWTLKDKSGFGTYRVLCKCKNCGGILSATRDDISSDGMKKARMFTTNGLITAALKKGSGKDMNTVYVKVEELGTSNADAGLKGKEFPIEELQEMANKF